MANIQINFDGTKEQLDRIFQSFAQAHGWSEQVDNRGSLIPNPVSFLEFSQNVIKAMVKESAIRDKVNKATLLAQTTAVVEATEDVGSIVVSSSRK